MPPPGIATPNPGISPEEQRRLQEIETARTSRIFSGTETRAGASAAAPAIAPPPAPDLAGLGLAPPPSTPSAQDRQNAFLNAAPDRRTVAADRVVAPASPNILQAGAVISAALITGIRSDLPGQITAHVTENIYDSPTGRILLVPQGTRVIGQYDNNVQFGQSRVLLVWNRLIFPNGRSIVLERQPGADAEGYAGLQDGVDYHWWDLAKAAGLSTLLSVGAELATNDDDRLISAIRNGGHPTRTRHRQPSRRVELCDLHCRFLRGAVAMECEPRSLRKRALNALHFGIPACIARSIRKDRPDLLC